MEHLSRLEFVVFLGTGNTQREFDRGICTCLMVNITHDGTYCMRDARQGGKTIGRCFVVLSSRTSLFLYRAPHRCVLHDY